MKKLGLATAFLAGVALLAFRPAEQTASPVATYISAAEVNATIASAPEGRVSDQPIRHVEAGGENIGVAVVQRPVTETLSAIQHHKQTEVYRIVTGRGILVTSPDLASGTELDPEGNTVKRLTGPSAVGTIEGGTSQAVGPGDVIVIPPGLAHGFSEITEEITYLLVRVDPEKLVELKMN